VLAAALWAAVAVRLARRRLRSKGVQARVPLPPRLGPGAFRGAQAVLRRYSPTCLERALVEQAWLAANGSRRDVVIGVPEGGLQEAPAHAWVDGNNPSPAGRYLELHRLPPPSGRRAHLGRWSRG